jgi:hypothetical protein
VYLPGESLVTVKVPSVFVSTGLCESPQPQPRVLCIDDSCAPAASDSRAVEMKASDTGVPSGATTIPLMMPVCASTTRRTVAVCAATILVFSPCLESSVVPGFFS